MNWGLESFDNLERMYGFVDFTDKVVLDIGADWGGTPAFFLKKGAKRVIGVDYSKWYVEKMYNHFKDDFRVLPLMMYIKTTQQLKDLIQIYRPDIVKLDCEGCERGLINLVSDVLRIPEEYIMETHGDDILAGINEVMARADFVLSQEHPREAGNTGIQYYIRVDPK